MNIEFGVAQLLPKKKNGRKNEVIGLLNKVTPKIEMGHAKKLRLSLVRIEHR